MTNNEKRIRKTNDAVILTTTIIKRDQPSF